jgi:hypothetical protein
MSRRVHVRVKRYIPLTFSLVFHHGKRTVTGFVVNVCAYFIDPQGRDDAARIPDDEVKAITNLPKVANIAYLSGSPGLDTDLKRSLHCE